MSACGESPAGSSPNNNSRIINSLFFVSPEKNGCSIRCAACLAFLYLSRSLSRKHAPRKHLMRDLSHGRW